MPLTDIDRSILIRASAKDPETLDQIAATVRKRYPSAFHTDKSLRLRIFVDAPLRGEPCCRVIRHEGCRFSRSERPTTMAVVDLDRLWGLRSITSEKSCDRG
ncbi:conserved hypothetical protein [Ricinus communis]|uniref:Uncharacterized protein n=1 Tax=Ricinus communis TaxID=3988 RepID=B9TBI3_RICCO|nr:conserved hypothetical protein [Ricinus communis]